MIFLAIILGLLPGFAWLIFYLKEDLHPEPKKLITFVFGAGALVTVVAYVLQCATFTTFFSFPSCNISLDAAIDKVPIISGFILITLLALIEEILKFGAAHWVVRKNTAFDEPVDAMIYMVVAALGFATVENFAIVKQIIMPEAAGFQGSFIEALRVVSLRFTGATLLHALASGIIGYAWAKTIREFGLKRFLVAGIAIATLLHAFFNYLIIEYSDKSYALVLLLMVGLWVITDFEKLKKEKI